MHIGIVAFSISREAGGIFDAARLLAQHLNRLPDTRVSIFGTLDEHTSTDLVGWGDCQVNYFTTKGPKVLRYAPALEEALLNADLDIVHQHGIWTWVSRAVLHWHKTTGRPHIVSPHGMLDEWALKNSGWKKKIVAALFETENLNRATCLHALCEPERDAIRNYGLKNPIEIIPNGANLPELREKTNKSTKTLLFLGRLHPKKGLENLILAWQAIDPKNWRLIIVGEGAPGYEARLRNLVGESSDNIELAGPMYHQDKVQAYRDADASILPSFSEGLPLSVLEAMAYGLPVIMTEACNLPAAFEHNAAYPIEPTQESIESGLRQLFSLSLSELRQTGKNGHQFVRENYAWPDIASKFHAIYQSLLT